MTERDVKLAARLRHEQESGRAKRVRPIHEIAREIRDDWKKVYFGAVPYLEALSTLGAIGDRFLYEDARTQVLYFLSNATTWRGPVARRIKIELKELLK